MDVEKRLYKECFPPPTDFIGINQLQYHSHQDFNPQQLEQSLQFPSSPLQKIPPRLQ
jgi:hypothetical protein